MSESNEPAWLVKARKLLAIAQNGLSFCKDPFDRLRYEDVREVAVQMMAEGSGMAPEAVRVLFAEDRGYATPKIDVRGVVFDEQGRLLLVKERQDGCWTLPGGWADVGDSPRLTVEKEIREESGFDARAEKLLAVWDRNLQGHPAASFHCYKIFIRCRLVGGEAADSVETDGVGFFGEEEMPRLSLARVLPAQLKRMFEHYRQPDLPADFD